MATTDFKSVQAYLAAQPDKARATLQRVCAVVRKALPGAEETISYQIPTYKLQGRAVLHVAGWKRHYSLYPATATLVAAFGEELAPYEVNDKGTIRFALGQAVPTKLIARLAKFRAQEVAESVAARPAPKPTAAKRAVKAKAKTVSRSPTSRSTARTRRPGSRPG